MQGSVKIEHVHAVRLCDVPSHVILGSSIWLSESIVMHQWRRFIVVHQRPIEQEIIIECIIAIEMRQETTTCSVVCIRDFTRMGGVAVGDTLDKHIAKPISIAHKRSGEIGVLWSVKMNESLRVPQRAHHDLKICSA